jgi:hypothetical protein
MEPALARRSLKIELMDRPVTAAISGPNSGVVHFVECLGEVYEFCCIEGIGQPNTSMCDMMKQDKSN